MGCCRVYDVRGKGWDAVVCMTQRGRDGAGREAREGQVWVADQRWVADQA